MGQNRSRSSQVAIYELEIPEIRHDRLWGDARLVKPFNRINAATPPSAPHGCGATG